MSYALDGSVTFSAREVEVLECFASAWMEGDDHRLYGNLSYHDVLDVFDKLKIDSSSIKSLVAPLRDRQRMADMLYGMGFDGSIVDVTTPDGPVVSEAGLEALSEAVLDI